jgi:hypothetical protein
MGTSRNAGRLTLPWLSAIGYRLLPIRLSQRDLSSVIYHLSSRPTLDTSVRYLLTEARPQSLF